MNIYFASVGRGTNLLLNLPPDRRGLLPEDDVVRLVEWRRALDTVLGTDLVAGRPVEASNTRANDPTCAASHLTDGRPETFWAADDGAGEVAVTVKLDPAAGRVGAVRIDEFIELGQRVERFAVDVELHGWQWQEAAVGTTIGPRQIVRIPPLKASAVRVRIQQAQAAPALRRLSVFAAS